ncbi:tetratricopeptide repeat protein [Prolixibacteraceae bacterium]|nr:tetratricopeptide repeat protein [Prolixibacteraceae bacterium]
MKGKLLCLLCIPLFMMCKTSKIAQTSTSNSTNDPCVKVITQEPIDELLSQKNENIRLALAYSKERMQNYDYKNALDTLESMYSRGNYNRRLLLQLESIRFIIGDYPSCISLLEKMDKDEPLSFQLSVHKGIVYRKSGNLFKAKDLFLQGLEKDSTNIFLLEQVGDMSKKISGLDQYQLYYLKAIKYGASVSVLNKYLSYLMENKQYEEALDAVYLYGPKLMTPYKSLRMNYGIILYRLKRYYDSFDIFNKLIEENTHRSLCYYYAGLSLCQNKKYKEAIPFLEYYIENALGGLSYSPYYVLGCCYLETKDNEKSLKMFNEAADMIYPDEEEIVSVYSKMADVYSAQKRYKEVAESLETIVKLFPDEEYALFQMALLHHSKTKNYKEAAVYYRKVLKSVNPSDTADNELKKYFYETSKSELKKLEKHLFWTK